MGGAPDSLRAGQRRDVIGDPWRVLNADSIPEGKRKMTFKFA
jgi:hypothetical protein